MALLIPYIDFLIDLVKVMNELQSQEIILSVISLKGYSLRVLRVFLCGLCLLGFVGCFSRKDSFGTTLNPIFHFFIELLTIPSLL
jgi:hypothetical protein